MDAESDSVPIEVYEPDGPKPAPLTTYYMHNLPDSITPTSRKWLLIGWIDSDERDITEHEEYNFDKRDKTTLHLVFWQLAAKLVKPSEYLGTISLLYTDAAIRKPSKKAGQLLGGFRKK